jgi:hypothetical protein
MGSIFRGCIFSSMDVISNRCFLVRPVDCSFGNIWCCLMDFASRIVRCRVVGSVDGPFRILWCCFMEFSSSLLWCGIFGPMDLASSILMDPLSWIIGCCIFWAVDIASGIFWRHVLGPVDITRSILWRTVVRPNHAVACSILRCSVFRTGDYTSSILGSVDATVGLFWRCYLVRTTHGFLRWYYPRYSPYHQRAMGQCIRSAHLNNEWCFGYYHFRAFDHDTTPLVSPRVLEPTLVPHFLR